jgi:hypothetical protein
MSSNERAVVAFATDHEGRCQSQAQVVAAGDVVELRCTGCDARIEIRGMDKASLGRFIQTMVLDQANPATWH